jgi:hypothetical protein
VYRCQKCQQLIGPRVAQNLVPTGFRKVEGQLRLGERLGEAVLCTACVAIYNSQLHQTAEALDGIHFLFFNGAHR